ncbi:MAG: hypothetical protein Q9187_002711 [Circinaria calcarea]
MAPQTTIPLAANVLGTIGTVFWCIQLIPQIWHNWRKKSTEGLPGLMLFLWAICAVPFGVYAIVQNFNIPIQIQPQMFGTLCLGPYNKGIEWPMLLIGIIAAVLIGAGLFPPYLEIWKRRGRVVGFNWIFLSVDWLGAFFSLMALVAQHTFDVLGGVVYIVCLVLEAGIFISHGLWLLRTHGLRKRAKLEGVKFDDLPEAQRYQVQRVKKSDADNASPRTDLIEAKNHPSDLERGSGVILSSNASTGSSNLKDLENGNGVISSSNASTMSNPPKEPAAERVEAIKEELPPNNP